MRRALLLLLTLCACDGQATLGDDHTDGSSSDAGVEPDAAPTDIDADVPAPEFWDRTGIPAATKVLTFKFLNRTHGVLDDAHVFWGFDSGDIHELHSIAEAPTYDMPANASGRMYFYLCPPDVAGCTDHPAESPYFDFIEHTIGADQYNGNTTRVDAFGLKLAMLLHCHDGFEKIVGEDQATFAEDRAATFQAFRDAVPAEFDHLAQPPFAPYRIVEPGRGEFRPGGLQEHYYDALVDEIWAKNGITVAKPGPNGSGLGDLRELSAGIFRHVGTQPGSFTPGGGLANQQLWNDATTFYLQPPANYYAQFWHTRSVDGHAYGFPFDDVGAWSSYVSHADPEYLLVAIGW